MSRKSWRLKYELRRKTPPNKEDAKLPLTMQSYKRKFHALLYYEEEEHVQVLKDRCDGKYQLTVLAKDHQPEWLYGRSYSRYGFLVGMSGDQVMYATQASGIVFVVDQDRHRDVCATEILGENYRAISEKFYLGFAEEEASKLERHYSIGSERYDKVVSIEFEVKHFYFDLLHDSLNNLTDESLAKLIPTADTLNKQQIRLQRIPYPEYPVLKLDKDFQFPALQLAMFSGSSAPVLIPGPFGTGKTRLLAVATYDFIKHGRQQHPPSPVRVLVCCHHQISADTFLERYFGVMQDHKVNPWEDAYLVRVTRESYAKNSRHQCYYLPVGEFRENAQEIIKEDYLVVVTTFLTAHSFRRVIGSNVFTHILIDEGAQAREPETIAPLSMANRDTKVVIAGDNQQVGPQMLVLGDIPQVHGLSTSLLERLLDHYRKLSDPAINQLTATLRTNYRCIKEILELPSSLFYQSQLIPAARGILPHPKAPYPLIFVCSSLQKVTKCIESDTSNIEAQFLISKLVEFLDPWPAEWKYRHLEDVCVMAISRRQISVLRDILRTDHPWLKRIQLFPTYEMQGREFRALFISTVECVDSSGRTRNPTKSLCNPYVFNTAITRAQSLVVAVGNPFTLLSVEASLNEPKYCWREFMSRCLKHNAFIFPSHIRDEDALKEIRSIIEKKPLKVTPPTVSDHARIKTESLPISEGQSRISAQAPQLRQNYLRSIKPQGTPPQQKTSVSAGAAETGIQLKPARLSQQKPITVSLRPQASRTVQLVSVQQPNSQHGIPRRSVQQSQHTGTQKPAVKQDVHLKPQQSRCDERDHPSPTLQQKAAKRQQGAQITHSHPPQSQCTLPSSASDAIRSTRFQPVASPQYDFHFPTLEVAAKTLKQRKQQISSIPNSFSEQHTPSLHSQFSHWHDYKATGYSHSHRPKDMNLLKSSLTRENYREKFHQLLCREEEEHAKLLAERCDGIYTLTIYGPYEKPVTFSHKGCARYGDITAAHLDGDKIAYAKQASEGYVYIFPNSMGIQIQAEIFEGYFPGRKGGDVIRIAFSDTTIMLLGKIYPGVVENDCSVCNIEVTFQLKYSYFDRQHDILHRISEEAIAKIMPLNDPHENAFVRDFQLSEKFAKSAKLDYFQLTALETIMKCAPKAPLLIVGSFGTGKTRLLARAAIQILQKNPRARVLVCAHHHSSVDSFVINYFCKERVSMVRLMTPRYRPPPNYEQWYRTAREMENDVHKVQLIVTTLLTSLHLCGIVERGHFTHILMDEGAQAREPEVLAPLTLADRNTKIVIAGDHKQVGPSLLVLGNKAQKYGLKVSLLERLHKHYMERPGADTHCVALLKNYRCHKALLSLPSYLFYNSALVTKPDAATKLHPRDHFPLHFICSDLDDSITEIKRSNNQKEAELLLSEVIKYVSNWPTHEWGHKDLSTICIMTATSSQKSTVLKMLRYDLYPELSGEDQEQAEVLTAYDIQGREFQAVFLSTAEPTTPEGKPTNPTKSPCSQYVFNTAITRSKSLVVCAGNPFLLMKSEKHMDNECQCWRNFIRRCIENKTLYVPSSSFMPPDKLEQQLLKLQRKVFSVPSDNDMGHAEQDADTILSAYKKAFSQIPQCKKCMVRLKAIGSNSQWEVSPEAEVGEYLPSHTINSDAYKCELVVKSHHKAEAYSIDPSHSVVTINGLKNRQRAFDGDIVWVEVAKRTDRGKCIGKVVSIHQQCHQLKYVCKVDRHSAIYFNPIDNKSPRLVNLPKLSRDLVHNYKWEAVNRGMDKDAQNDYIVVFDEETLPADEHDPQLPKIKELISADCAEHLLFVVKVLGWLPKYRLPLGAVVDACPRGITYFHAERLLRVAHNISVTDPTFAPEDESLVPDDKEQGNTELYSTAITIDPPDATCLDDALSLTCIDESTYKVAVLIANVAKFLKANSRTDKEAVKRGTSVYGSREQIFMQMLSPSISSKFSLLPGDTRSVICVCAGVTFENGSISTISDVDVKEAKMCSKARLTYKQAQEILESKQMEWNDTLVRLFKIAMHLRIERLNNAAYSYEISDTDEENNWQAHLLVEELMIWANKSIAQFLYQRLPESTLLRRQAAPPDDVVAAFKGSFSSVGGYSLAMNHYNFRPPIEPLLVLKTTAKDIRDAISSKNIPRLIWLLTCDNRYPQLAAAKAQRVLMSHRADYVCSSKDGTVHSEDEAGTPHYPPYWHHSLRLSHYTHFTSPIRRYADLIVHRLLQAIFNGSTPDYSPDELSKVCRHLNLRSRAAREFQSTMDKLERAIEFGESCGEAQAFIMKGEKNTYDLCFTDLFYKPLQGKDMKIHHSTLKCSHNAENPDILRWRVKIASMKSQKFLLCHPQLDHFSEKERESKHFKSDTDAIMVKVLHRNEESGELPVQKPGEVLSNALMVSEYAASLVPEVVSVPPEACQKIHNFIVNPVEANLATLSDYYQPMSHSTSPKEPEPKGIASKFAQSPVIMYDGHRSLKGGIVVKVWLGRSLRPPIMCPSLQLIEVAPEFSICVEHNQHPAECFSDTNLHQASRPKYLSIQDYVNLWEKVLLAEAAKGSVEDGSLVLVKDVTLQWPELKIPTNCTEEIYYIPNGNVIMDVPLESQNMMEYIELEEGSLVCARYKLPTLRAVYHMVVNNVHSDDEAKPTKISMKPINSEACRVSKKMCTVMAQNPPCDIQLINLQPSSHRVYQNLLRLVKKDPASLANRVALGRIEVNGMNSTFSATSVFQTEKDLQLWDATCRTELNLLQRRAIEYGVKRSFQLIQGPPGTGKSVTGAHLAYILAKLNRKGRTNSCVVYCGPSNKAVDVVHDKLQKANNEKGLNLRLLRLYGRTHERKDFPGPYSSDKDGILRDLNIEGRCQKRFLCDALHQKVRSASCIIRDMEEEFQVLHQKNLLPSPGVLREYKQLIKTVEKQVMSDHYDIILCTCNETASRRMLQLAKLERISQCIVDESGMSHEPETIAAVSLCNHVVLIGDHKQLQPVIKHSPARENGMSTSLFERYAEHFPRGLLITLDTQYRMHEAICQFPSVHFYEGCLKAGKSLSKRSIPGTLMEQFWPQGLKLPIVFCNVVGEEGEVFDAKTDKGKVDPHSKCNEKEAEKALEVVSVLHNRHGVEYKEIAVITPYSAQKSLIHQLNDERSTEAIASSATKSVKSDVAGGPPAKPTDTKLNQLTVVSITESQGDEYGYVILSTVRSQPVEEIENHDLVQPDRRWLRDHLGFLTDSHEINVGITRAKYGLIIIGNRCLLEYDKTWKALIDHYREKKCIVEGRNFPIANYF